jgi:N-acetylglucosaminyl-diphospho-decaprenol L-rhamnosyltransferase
MSSMIDLDDIEPGTRSTRPGLDDLAIITVSTNEAQWIRPCLRTVFEHAGDIRLDVVVVDNDSSDGTAQVVATEFPRARVVPSSNHGFSHANNRGLMTCNARYVLFLNPDTEILDGTFAELVRMMDERPHVGLVGARQITGQGRLDRTIRRFPNALRAVGDALWAERLPRRPHWLGERELDAASYEREFACDWTSGSFMLARREAIESAGYLDERYFMYSDETDLCRRIKLAGWEIRHLPQMTILHHDGKAGINPNIESLAAHTRMMYARKYFSPVHRLLYGIAVALRHLVRSVYAGRGETGRLKRAANRRAIATLLGRAPVPYAERTCVVSVTTADPALRTAGGTAP